MKGRAFVSRIWGSAITPGDRRWAIWWGIAWTILNAVVVVFIVVVAAAQQG